MSQGVMCLGNSRIPTGEGSEDRRDAVVSSHFSTVNLRPRTPTWFPSLCLPALSQGRILALASPTESSFLLNPALSSDHAASESHGEELRFVADGPSGSGQGVSIGRPSTERTWHLAAIELPQPEDLLLVPATGKQHHYCLHAHNPTDNSHTRER